MALPQGITIGTQLTAKRGRRVEDCTVRQIHRPDRACSVITATGHRYVLPWTVIRKNYRTR